MKVLNLKKIVAVGLTLTSAAFTSDLHAAVTVFIEGGSASQSVLYDRATNFFTASGGSLTNVVGSGAATVSRFQGNAGGALAGFNPITIDFNVANGAVAGLQALSTQVTGPGDTNVLGVQTVPNLVDSAASPDGIGNIDSSHFATPLPTFVVPLVYIKNANSADTAAITNLTQRQAVSLETSSPLQAAFYGGASTNKIYFVGRNTQAATDWKLNAELLTYSRSKGLFAGIDLTGTSVTQSNDDTVVYYGAPHTFEDILHGNVPVPDGAKPFVRTIAKYFRTVQK